MPLMLTFDPNYQEERLNNPHEIYNFRCIRPPNFRIAKETRKIGFKKFAFEHFISFLASRRLMTGCPGNQLQVLVHHEENFQLRMNST